MTTMKEGWALSTQDRRRYTMQFNTLDKNKIGKLLGQPNQLTSRYYAVGDSGEESGERVEDSGDLLTNLQVYSLCMYYCTCHQTRCLAGCVLCLMVVSDSLPTYIYLQVLK